MVYFGGSFDVVKFMGADPFWWWRPGLGVLDSRTVSVSVGDLEVILCWLLLLMMCGFEFGLGLLVALRFYLNLYLREFC